MGRFDKFAQKRISLLEEHLENYMQKKETENLHKIRVDIKKIKAMLLFVNDRIKGFKAHTNYIPFRTLFRRAGEIREPEVLIDLLLAHNINGVHDQRIEGSSEKLVKKFCEDIPSFIYAVNKQWAKLQPLFRKLKKEDLEKYLRKTKKKIKSKLHPNPNMDLIHRTRKSIKGFIYLSEADRKPKKKLMKFYVKEVEAIGNLHDTQVLLNLLTKQNGAADKTHITKIRQECNNKKDEIRKIARAFYEG